MKNLLLICLFLFLSACSNNSESRDPGSGDSSLSLNTQTFSAVADGSGRASFNFSLPAGTNAFQLSASNGSLGSLSASGVDLKKRADLLSSFQAGNVSNVAYYAGSAAGLESISASYVAAAGTNVTLKVYSKSDSDLTSGVLKINIILLGPAGNSEQTNEALDSALGALRVTFGRANISLDTQISSYEGPGRAPLPGDPLYQSIVSSQRSEAVNIIIAADRVGSTANELEYGIVGSTPFPAQATAQSVVVISLDDLTGNGVFDDSEHNDEDRLMAEEIGRFVANALGLPNLLSLRGDRVTESDNIPDSPSCISKESCEDDGNSRTNLMFPEPVRDDDPDRDDRNSGSSYFPRDQLTDMQKQVLNNSVFVD